MTDKSGRSYRAVYEQIISENDLIFEIDSTFEFLDGLEKNVYVSCFYKALTPEELSQLSQRHQEAVERISGVYEDNITPGLVAQRIVDNLTDEDFELEFFRMSALLAFYRISSPTLSLNLGFPTFNPIVDPNRETLKVILNPHSQIIIDEKVFTAENAELKIYEFLSTDSGMKGIVFTASRDASYKSYLNTIEMFSSIYLKLKSERGDIPMNIIFKEL